MMRGLLDEGVKSLFAGVLPFLLLLLLLSGVVGGADGIDDCMEAEEEAEERGRRDGDDAVNFEFCVFRGNVKEEGNRVGRGGGGGGGG